MKIDFYFLNFKFSVFLEEKLEMRVRKFWKGFLEKNDSFQTTENWIINFERSDKTFTTIDYEKKTINHCHQSICDLTEFNNLFREAVVKLSAMSGILWLHCSAFSLNNKTYLVVGNKNFGKTTMLLNALSTLKATFIGNDQLPLFIFNGNLCCLSWRPDIKISNNKENCKEFYLVNNRLPYDFIDFEKMSARLGKNIEIPKDNREIIITNNKIFAVTDLLLLNEQQEVSVTHEKIMNYVKNDQETILPYKLLNMEKYIPYWNKRIKDANISPSANKILNETIKNLDEKCTKILVGNRLNFNLVARKVEGMYDYEK